MFGDIIKFAVQPGSPFVPLSLPFQIFSGSRPQGCFTGQTMIW